MNGGASAPIDAAQAAPGLLTVDSASLQELRDAMGILAPSLTLNIASSGVAAPCLAGQVCGDIDFATSASADVLTNLVTGAPTDPLVAAILPGITFQDTIVGTAFEDLAALSADGTGTIHFAVDAPSISVRAPQTFSETVQNHVPTGVYADVNAEFTNFLADFSCDCENPGSSALPLPSDGCVDLCSTLYSSVTCTDVDVTIKINHLPFVVGFEPRMPATGNGSWTSKLFPGAKAFHLQDMFDLSFHVASFTDNLLAASEDTQGTSAEALALVQQDTTHDIAVFADVKNCEFGSAILCGLGDCNQEVANAVVAKITQKLALSLKDQLSAQLAPLFDYDNAALPPSCDLASCDATVLQEIVAASLTYQKWDWFAGAFGPYPNGGWLKINGITAAPDSSALTFYFDPDPDNDGIPTPSDNCLGLHNPTQTDTDGDGKGDACDVCPCDPNDDPDFDGYCGIACPGAVADNCPAVSNTGQENCNAVSEQFHNAAALGDACDPVPCPDVATAPKVTTTLKGGVPGQTKVWFTCWNEDYSELGLRPLASHSDVIPNLSAQVSGVPTETRFCQADSSQGITCEAQSDIRDLRLNDAACAAGCALPELINQPFHRVTFDPGQGNGVDPDGTPATLDYAHLAADPFPAENWTWRFADDANRWIQGGLVNVSTPDQLSGTFWTHAATTVGAVSPNPLGTGVHGTELANHHALDFKPVVHDCSMGTSIVLGPLAGGCPPPCGLNPALVWRVFSNPPWEAPIDPFHLPGTERGQANVILPLDGGEWGAMTSAGDALFVTERMGPHLLSRLADPTLVWANLAEPMLGLGRGPDFPIAVALSSDGSAVVDTVATDGVSLLAEADRSLVRSVISGSPHADDYHVVLSSVRGGVFVVGGEHVGTDQHTGELWFASLDQEGDRWTQMRSPGYVPEKVLAATYSFASDDLYVLDERSDGNARLVAIDLATMETVEVASWPRLPGWSTHRLVVDRDGSVLLARSSTGAAKHRIDRFVAGSSGPELSGCLTDSGHLVLPPVVDGRGVTRAIYAGGSKPLVMRDSALPFMSCGLQDLEVAP